MNADELADDSNGEIEIFAPVELRKLFNACLPPVRERGKMRDREAMVPCLAIAAFCGLRSAEIARLDWSEAGSIVGRRRSRQSLARPVTPLRSKLTRPPPPGFGA